MLENTTDLYPILFSSKQVIPRVYLGKTISQENALLIISNGKKLQRNNTPGLIYGKFQHQMGWETILASPFSIKR